MGAQTGKTLSAQGDAEFERFVREHEQKAEG